MTDLLLTLLHIDLIGFFSPILCCTNKDKYRFLQPFQVDFHFFLTLQCELAYSMTRETDYFERLQWLV